MFGGQWVIGLVLDLWPQTPGGYAAEAYPWAFGLVWAIQLAGLLWLGSKPSLLTSSPSAGPAPSQSP